MEGIGLNGDNFPKKRVREDAGSITDGVESPHDSTVPIEKKVAISDVRDDITRSLAIREKQLRELLFLESGGNLVDYDESSPSISAALATFLNHQKLIKGEQEDESTAEQRKHDAEILKRVSELQKQGLWTPQSSHRPRVNEPFRAKVHWDHLLAEMAWLSNDFREERKYKGAWIKKLSTAVIKHHKDAEVKKARRVKEEEAQVRKLAKDIATEVKKQFWGQIERLVQYRIKLKADEKMKKRLGEHLDALVGQTEKFSEQLARDLARDHHMSDASPKVKAPSTPEGKMEIDEPEPPRETGAQLAQLLSEGSSAQDKEFVLEQEESDDEATIEKEETEWKDEDNEEELLAQEQDIPIEELMRRYQEMEEEEEPPPPPPPKKETKEEDGERKERMTEAAHEAKAAQPTGFTLSTTKVKTKLPFLLRGTLREYQHIGLDWLVTMYEKQLNGILADEMGLGKTIQTISMLAHLACEREIWGPHLIVVPTTLMLNWELEFKRWCPAFKILTYFGSVKERKQKRQGWSKDNSFHVCITSYKLVIQDHAVFRRKRWHYLILDEAHHIKNFKSQRWQMLLNFNSERRLLLTGTPLQNDLMELWSLMHFLMPAVFQSHKEFKDWFSNPVNTMIEGDSSVNEGLIQRLHGILRPFLLRRLKSEVERQLPSKHEHIVRCRLSKRQRYLYEEFMQSATTASTLESGNFLGIVNVLMQLRKVCNHPDLFEGRPIVSSFDQEAVVYRTASLACQALDKGPWDRLDLELLGFVLPRGTSKSQVLRTWELNASNRLLEMAEKPREDVNIDTPSSLLLWKRQLDLQVEAENSSRIRHSAYVNDLRCLRNCMSRSWDYDMSDLDRLILDLPSRVHCIAAKSTRYFEYSNALLEMIRIPSDRIEELQPVIENFVCIIPRVRASAIQLHCSHPPPWKIEEQLQVENQLSTWKRSQVDVLRPAAIRTQLYFPDRRLIQYDCGKLQELAVLLRKLKSGGHRCLIFTQMTRMLDVLEIFLNIYGYTYVRLDGSTRVEKRQMLMERFNQDSKIFIFILSTRSGGIGINLTGADTVIFYDSDWNPAMDAQAQDRCHRIGQTRTVHIYRLVSSRTVEENILKKAHQKRLLDDVVIQGGAFTTDWFKNLDVKDLFAGDENVSHMPMSKISSNSSVSQSDFVKVTIKFQVEFQVDIELKN
eukprot:TRINITY_DN1170_c3_g1_i2.p1 TRINITY_DN1170_c3_g1~~TRINITY_DN1170_c3_g1_i2.p1  ORF type:complete len:1172 (-),score=371.67 TRINITY_DN1170_c3_g1_i2:332-3847(-)